MGQGDGACQRMVGRPVGALWGEIVDLSFAATGSQWFHVPAGKHVSEVKRQLDRRLVLNHGITQSRGGTYIAAAATWLQLPYSELTWLIDVLYERVGDVDVDEEARRLDTLSVPAAWKQPKYQLLAELIRLNGVGKVLWCCASLVLEMMHALWDEHP